MTIAFDAASAPFSTEDSYVQKPATASNRFSPEVAKRLLDKLCSDDAFRALFLSDVRAALREVGHETAPESLGVPGSDPVMCCIEARSLASKESLCASRALLETRLSTSMFHYNIEL